MAPPASLTTRALNRATLARQGLLTQFRRSTAADAIRHVASLQAQHPEWPAVALASRAADARTADLAGALDDRTAVRSSLMRATIHVVASDDLWSMFAVCRRLRLDQWRLLMKADPTDSPLGRRMTAAHTTALAALAERPRSSSELDRIIATEVGARHLARARPIPRAAWRHLAAHVALVHVPHAEEGYGRSLYAAAESWLGEKPDDLDVDRSRANLARRYFAAFGPASLEDLVAYVGRGRGGIGPWKTALADLAEELVELRGDDGRTLYDLDAAPRPGEHVEAPPRLLARWDSLLLSHAPKERARVIAGHHRASVFTKNADVLPTFLVDGFVAGTWELGRRDGEVTVAMRPFGALSQPVRAALEDEAHRVLRLVAPGAADRAVAWRR